MAVSVRAERFASSAQFRQCRKPGNRNCIGSELRSTTTAYFFDYGNSFMKAVYDAGVKEISRNGTAKARGKYPGRPRKRRCSVLPSIIRQAQKNCKRRPGFPKRFDRTDRKADSWFLMPEQTRQILPSMYRPQEAKGPSLYDTSRNSNCRPDYHSGY